MKSSSQSSAHGLTFLIENVRVMEVMERECVFIKKRERDTQRERERHTHIEKETKRKGDVTEKKREWVQQQDNDLYFSTQCVSFV